MVLIFDTRLGLAVARHEVRGVVVSDGEIVWRAARGVAPDEPLSEAIVAVLADAPARRTWPRTRVVATIGPSASQVKELTGLPDIHDRRVVSQLVAANPSRFFLRPAGAVVAGPVWHTQNAWWAAIFDGATIASIELAAQKLGIHLEACVPAPTAVARAHRNGLVICEDGDARVGVTVRDGQWISVRRAVADAPPAAPHNALAKLGHEHARYADAYGAACCNRRSPLALRREKRRDSSRRLRRPAVIAAGIVTLLAAFSARGALAARQIAASEERLKALRAGGVEWATTAARLQETNATIDQIARFADARISTVQLLASITAALPESTAVVSLRVDSISASIVLISASAAAVIPRLAAIPGIADVRASGTLTREIVAGARLQRIAVRFRIGRNAPRRNGRPP